MNHAESVIHLFLQALDEYLATQVQPGERVDLYQLGGALLVMHYGSPRATKDFDVVDVPSSSVLQSAIAAFGKQTSRANDLGMYLDAVNPSLPPLPGAYKKRAEEVKGNWRVIRLWKLEPHDYVISKIRAFRSWDQADIRHLITELELRGQPLSPDVLQERFDNAFAWYEKDPFREDALENLQRVMAFIRGE